MVATLGGQGVVSLLTVIQSHRQGYFPGGSAAKNPPANAGDRGSVPDQGRSHMQGSNQAVCRSYLSTATEPTSPRARSANKSSHRDERPERCSSSSPARHSEGKAHVQR